MLYWGTKAILKKEEGNQPNKPCFKSPRNPRGSKDEGPHQGEATPQEHREQEAGAGIKTTGHRSRKSDY